MSILPLLLSALPQTVLPAPRAPTNLGAIYKRNFAQGKLTLDDGFLALSEPRAGGVTRVVVYDTKHGKRVLALNRGTQSDFQHDQCGSVVVTSGVESFMGDLNGDGDALDLCAVVHDVATDRTLPLLAIAALTSPSYTGWNPDAGRDLVGLTLSEAGEGTSLNGDGDLADFVGAAWIPSESRLVVPGVASQRVHLFDGALVLQVGEGSQHRDFTGDGDRQDVVYLVHDLATGTLESTGVALASFGRLSFFEARTLAFAASETESAADLDGDGVIGGDLLQAYSLDRGVRDNLGTNGPTYPHLVVGRFVAFGLRESAHGDRNGDGDALDLVLHVYDGATGAIQNVGLALDTTAGGAPWLVPLFGETALGFGVDEESQGADLNGDGMLQYRVFHVLDLATGALHDTGLVGNASGGVLSVNEAVNGDRNGDGDELDVLTHLLAPPPAVGVTLDIGFTAIRVSGRWVALIASERQEGDLNSDGDAKDYVLHSYDRVTGTLANLGLSATVATPVVLAGRTVALTLAEGGVDDWNRDGDRTDAVVHLVDLGSGAIRNLGLATDPSCPMFLGSKLFAFVVNEADQGADLDGNGLIENVSVVHVLDRASGQPVD